MTDTTVEQDPPTVLLVSTYTTGTIYQLDTVTGEVLGDFGAVPGAQSVHSGPDGGLYLVAEEINQVLRRVGGENTPFVWDDPDTEADETGGLSAPTSAVWGADGLLYVGGFGSDSVHRYDASGGFVDVFAAVDSPDAGMQFGPDGNLYVPSFYGDEILVLDGEGALVRSIGTIRRPRSLHFDDQDVLWVTAWSAGVVARFALDGTRLEDVADIATPSGLAVWEDIAWVGTDQTNVLTLIDVATGEVLTTIDGAALGMEGVTYLTWE